MQSTAQLPYLSVIVIGWLSSYDIHVLVVATCNHWTIQTILIL